MKLPQVAVEYTIPLEPEAGRTVRDEVLTFEQSGSPEHTVSRTLQIFLNRAQHKAIAPRRTYRNPVILAQEWQAMIDDGQVRSRAELATRLGVSRARVTQMLQLLKLNPSIIDAIVQLGDPLPEPTVTERHLRPLARLDRGQQMRRFKHLRAIKQTSERSGTSD